MAKLNGPVNEQESAFDLAGILTKAERSGPLRAEVQDSLLDWAHRRVVAIIVPMCAIGHRQPLLSAANIAVSLILT